MKIYALRDRQIDYFLTPFAAPNEHSVFASLAATINNLESRDAIAQAPHHFEIWQIGTVNEDGHLEAEKIYLANCSRFIRTGIRTNEERATGAGTSQTEPGGLQGRPSGERVPTGTQGRAHANAPQGAPGAPTQDDQRP